MAVERRRLSRKVAWLRGLIFPVLVVVPMLAWPSPAVACTRPIWNRPYHPAATTLAAEGWIERVVPRPDRPVDFGAFTSLDVVIRTEVAHKGWVPDRLVFREDRSFVARVDARGNVLSQGWAGSSGACGMFDADPTGRYILVALGDDSDLVSPGSPYSVGIGNGPNDPWVVRLRQEIHSYPSLGIPPRIVQATAESGFELWASRLPFLAIVALAIGGAGLALSLAVGGLVLKRLRRNR